VTIAVIAEKPSVARDIAAVLGATSRCDGYFDGGGYAVTWAFGHLVTLAQPHEISPQWKPWKLEMLPMLPGEFPLVIVSDTKAQFAVIKRLICSRDVEQVVCATDAGREGELIFRYIYDASGCKKPVRRLWISSLTPEAIRDGFRRLKSSTEYDRLADAARGRSIADWLVGMNLSRAYGITLAQEISVGRVQTPTLAMIVERELAIRAFIPEDYYEVMATFTLPALPGGSATSTYRGTWFRPETAKCPSNEARKEGRRLGADGVEAKAIVARVSVGHAVIASVTSERRRFPPPLLYDLTELQRHANRLFGLTAQRSLDVAQALYEKHKLISYPRTDSRHLSYDIAQTLPAIARALGPRYASCQAKDYDILRLGRRFIDDTKVSDHHAIIPTGTQAREDALSLDERRIYDLICRRILQAFHDEHEFSTTTVTTEVVAKRAPKTVDHFESRGTVVERIGWKCLDLGGESSAFKVPRKNASSPGDLEAPDAADVDQLLPVGLAQGQSPDVTEVEQVKKRTRPPKRHTEATLLTAMESAGASLDEKELSDALRERGLGTPATRAPIIETLLRREYIARQGKSLSATDKGIDLVSVVHSQVKSPSMTGEWELKLKQLEQGRGTLKAFLADIEAYVTSVIETVKGAQLPVTSRDANAREARPALPIVGGLPQPAASRRTPTAPQELHSLLQSAFGFPSFRPHQEAVCRAITEGSDVLLVMPTGAGKSLCYQLPGIARAGTTLVISPLIALMDDQASKLSAQGFAAERLHSGRSRTQSRQICIDYLAGKLDFLFIAPERLRVPGFPELLAKRPPGLVAIDEAHCISQWGHDFRPDYRLLGKRLPQLRPAPIVALTATATPRVQDDIASQLGLSNPARFIHGFRRSNLAISVVERSPKERVDAIVEMLSNKAHRPAIVYASTRKQAERIGAALGKRLAGVYHAGIDTTERERVQMAFLAGTVDVIVATVAFGMGIDKPNVRTVIHAALPGSVEGYYQEIGRAGRDGANASAILFYSYVDRKTHEFFNERDYPDVERLRTIYAKLNQAFVVGDKLRRKVKMPKAEFDSALEKLEAFGGAVRNADDGFVKGADNWEVSYLSQREHRFEQLEKMLHFTKASGCRMIHLVSHFGDHRDNGARCGMCDSCAPDSAVLVPSLTVKRRKTDTQSLSRILATLSSLDGLATGRLYLEAFPSGKVDRRAFEGLLQGLCEAGLVTVRETTFEKDGKVITYRLAALTEAGRRSGAASANLEGLALPTPATKTRRVARKAKKTKTSVVKKSKWFFVNRAKRSKSDARKSANNAGDPP